MADNSSQQQPNCQKVVKAVAAISIGGCVLLLAGLTLAATVIGLTLATPLLVIFSPILLPAAMAASLLITGFLTSGGLGVAGVSVLSWLYQYVTGKHPPGSDQLHQAEMKLQSAVKDMKEKRLL
ncbi:PREDICTED: oleosin 1-like [Nelumbo nucifera]|uniref:Oleosin n=1 Tax=Nelumbo nucifera TaxID=4432 RepID=A0A1U8B3R6_NELNU|nr:PREDICTED: oleosin 1-like [Nelumbo nucifera]